jgi:predicted Zn-dependent protease
VPAALFVTAQDEAEFAGMLAHAMEHIAQRHGTRQATRGQIANPACIPLIFMGGRSCGDSEALLLPKAFLATQRSNELEADALAVQTMAHAGFDPMALARYIERVQLQPTTATRQTASALPDREQRLASMRSAIEKLPFASYAAPAQEFAAVQQEVRRLMARRAPRDAPATLKRSGSK